VNCSLENKEKEYFLQIHNKIKLEGNIVLQCETKKECDEFILKLYQDLNNSQATTVTLN